MSEDNERNAHLKLLEHFVGTWHSKGMTSDGRTVPIRGVDTYEWMEGGYCLLHHMDAHIDKDHYKAIELIGYDAASEAFAMHLFDSWGGMGSQHASVQGDTWTFTGDTSRAKLIVSDVGDTMTGHWEMSEDGKEWHPWMDLTMSRAK